MEKPNDVDSYIESAPKEFQAKLMQIRRAIKQAAPTAIERISYGMPYYGYKGRLAYFRLGKGYIRFYIPPIPFMEETQEIRKYKTSKSTFQFPLGTKLPVTFIKKIIKARMKYNEETENHIKSILNKLKNKRSVAS